MNQVPAERDDRATYGICWAGMGQGHIWFVTTLYQMLGRQVRQVFGCSHNTLS